MSKRLKTESPKYVVNFKKAYEALLPLYKEKGNDAFIKDGLTTPEFNDYINAVREFIKIRIKEDSSIQVKSLLSSGEYVIQRMVLEDGEDSRKTVYENNELVDVLLEKIIIEKEMQKQSFLKKDDAKYAFNSMKIAIHNDLIDLIKETNQPIPITKKSSGSSSQKVYFQMVSLDSPVIDTEGNECLLESITADSKKDFFSELMENDLLKYGMNKFVHIVIKHFLAKEQTHYILGYLNGLLNGDAKSLYNIITKDGVSTALYTLIDGLKEKGFDFDYLKKEKLVWKYQTIKENYPNNWRDNAQAVAWKLSQELNLL